MTEQEWLSSTDPGAMLRHFSDSDSLENPISDRKLSLFACACCRQVWHLLTDERSRTAVEAVERAADSGKPPPRYHFIRAPAASASPGYGLADMAWMACASRSVLRVDATIIDYFRYPHDQSIDAAAAHILRDIVGNPFRPVKLYLSGNGSGEVSTNPSGDGPWWSLTPTVRTLAESAYQERLHEWQGRSHDHDEETGHIETGTLDPVRLSILADALEESGCDNADILNHLRGLERCPECLQCPGSRNLALHGYGRTSCLCDGGWIANPHPHYRGCWVVDLLLGKE